MNLFGQLKSVFIMYRKSGEYFVSFSIEFLGKYETKECLFEEKNWIWTLKTQTNFLFEPLLIKVVSVGSVTLEYVQ